MSIVDLRNAFYRNAGKDFSSAFTSFNELTTSSADSLFDLKSIYGTSELRDEVATTGSGSVTLSEGLLNVSTGVTAGSTATLDSVDRGRYIAGFDAIPGIAVAVPTMPVGDQVARWGYFDETHGFGTGVDANGFFTFLRYGGVETIHRRSAWRNKLAGVFVEDRLNVYRYPFRWYGSGPVRFQVSTQGDLFRPNLSQYDAFASVGSQSIIQSANLKIRAEVSGGDNFSIAVGGRQFFIQGDYNPLPRFSSESRLAQTVGTTFVPLISAKQSTGLLETVSCRLASLSLLVSGAPILAQIRIGATVAEPTAQPSDIPSGEAAMLYDNTATTMTGGFKIYEKLIGDGQGNSLSTSQQDLPELALPDNKTITLCARALAGTATVNSVFTIKEEW